MPLSKSFVAILLGGGLSYASSLSVYQDKSFYNFSPKNNFIGFSQGLEAKCQGATILLDSSMDCPLDNRLCKRLNNLKSIEQNIKTVQANTKVLEQLISLPQPTTFDAAVWIESAKRIGEEQARLLEKQNVLIEEAKVKQEAFEKQTSSKLALQTTTACKQDVGLTIPYGYISFSTKYEADIADEKEVTVTQYLSVTNKSGIDIQADNAMFYYRAANQYVRPIYFNPWIVKKYVPISPRVQKTSMKSEEGIVAMDMANEAVVMSPVPAEVEPIASYKDTREYKVENLNLPSMGVPLDIQILTWKAALFCEVRAYPYADTQAFHTCSFKPKFQIDSNNWEVKSKEQIINENAVGEYREDTYKLYTKVEEDIKIVRTPIVQKEQETGIFGGTARKKDGFILTLINKSDKEKTLLVTERIPTSTTQEIKAKLLSINSDKEVNYTLLKDGQIEMKVTLAANENKKIEVLFEISYDKDLKVDY